MLFFFFFLAVVGEGGRASHGSWGICEPTIFISYLGSTPICYFLWFEMYNDTEDKKESPKERNGPRIGVKWPRNIWSQLGL